MYIVELSAYGLKRLPVAICMEKGSDKDSPFTSSCKDSSFFLSSLLLLQCENSLDIFAFYGHRTQATTEKKNKERKTITYVFVAIACQCVW